MVIKLNIIKPVRLKRCQMKSLFAYGVTFFPDFQTFKQESAADVQKEPADRLSRTRRRKRRELNCRRSWRWERLLAFPFVCFPSVCPPAETAQYRSWSIRSINNPSANVEHRWFQNKEFTAFCLPPESNILLKLNVLQRYKNTLVIVLKGSVHPKTKIMFSLHQSTPLQQ